MRRGFTQKIAGFQGITPPNGLNPKLTRNNNKKGWTDGQQGPFQGLFFLTLGIVLERWKVCSGSKHAGSGEQRVKNPSGFWSEMCFGHKKCFFSPFLVINSLKMGFLTPSEPQLWPPRDHERFGRADASWWCFPLQNPSPARISGNHNPLSSSELKSGEFVVVWAWGLFSRAEPTGSGCSVTGGSASHRAAEVQPRGRGSVN